ncbi:hypothetical protein Q2T41_10405 [Maribacter confluentis]|uniref:Fibronectin type-III domain-containing protein n=1 Tax=Maribacter confluentis TaxID=1656093 RepID=A0ABT8RQA7_9FLAO|nr:hypothetical protein [Maribacter confluentis]MDO1513067.1 hypothetical protein [Maribacter confluentis]
MKGHLLKCILILSLFSIGCTGEFVKDKRAIFLKAPLDNTPCLEGESDGLLVNIPFEWSVDGDNENLMLLIDELDSNKKILDSERQKIIDLNKDQTSENVFLDFGKWYQWQITAGNGSVKSEVFTFYSEGFPSINRAPFPAEITIRQRNEGKLIFTWIAPIDPNNDRLVYDAFFGETRETPSEIKSNMLEPEVLEVPNPKIGSEYYLKIVSKEVFEDNSFGNASIALIKVLVEN